MFRFKKFIVHQDQCAMKVCTDACLFGAWVANKIKNEEIIPASILDIGAGTGLLSLMLAQVSAATIDGIEIDAAAAAQAKANIQASPWSDRIRIHHVSVKDFAALHKYDLIISNPPFYENQLRSPDSQRNTAMHATELSFSELAKSVKNNLSKKGIAAILLPTDKVKDLEIFLGEQSLFIQQKLNISHSAAHPFFRTALLISFENTNLSEAGLSIKDSTGEYSGYFISLLKDYYLAF